MQVDSAVIFSIDAETVGLYGDHFAVGWSIRYLDKDADVKEIESGYEACPIEAANGSDNDREWVLKNVVPKLPKETTVKNPTELYEKIWQVWGRVKATYKDVKCVADCGYPVEANLFRRCVELKEEERRFDGPYPLHEVATALLMARMKREDVPMLDDEKPEHHPTNDARYSGRLFWEAYHRSGK